MIPFLLQGDTGPSAPVFDALASSAAELRIVPFTREGWDGEFPGGSVTTVLGEPVNVTPEGVEQYMGDGGENLFGMIRPVLEGAAYVTVDGGVLRFHRAVKSSDGAVLGYATVSLTASALAIVMSKEPPEAARFSDVPGAVLVSEGGEPDTVFKSLSVIGDRGVTITDFDLASSLMGWGREFFKADRGPIPDGARWITVHPHGDGSKGVPILVQPAKDNSGTFHVIGGAGGKLNMLKLRGVKSEAEYKQDASEKAAAKRQAKKEQVAADKEAGIHEAKVEARKNIIDQKKQAQKDFIATVADAMGWDEAELAPNLDGVSPEAHKKVESQHHAQLLARAKAAVDLQRKALVADADMRAAAQLGEVPLVADGDQLSVSDLNDIAVDNPDGIAHAFKERAEAAGLTEEKLDEQVSGIQQAEQAANGSEMTSGSGVNVNSDKSEVARRIREEAAKVPPLELKAKVAEAQKAVAMLKAHKQLAALEKAAREANKAVDASHVEPKAYVLATGDVDDKDVLASVEDDVRTMRARAFLSEVESSGGHDALELHAAAGAYNAVNSLSHAVGGDSLVDRSVVDVLGVAATAQIIARRLHTEFGEDAGSIASGLEDWHLARSDELQQSAIAEAAELQAQAKELEVGEASHAGDIAAAAEVNRQRKQMLADSKRVLGHALGEMEANAALVLAMREGKRDSTQVSLGKTSLETAVKSLWALGLKDEDYSISRESGNVFVTVNAGGMDKLASGVDRENAQRVARNLAIMNGEQDEDGWLPDGFAKRGDLGLDLPAGVAPSLAQPFDATAGDLTAALRDYVGGRAADGEPAADILSDIQSGAFFSKVGDRADEYRAALDAVAPTKGGDGRQLRAEDIDPIFQQYADDYVQAKWGGARSALNRQTIEVDEHTQDALHRALSAEPAGVSAYKQIGELTHKDRRALRDWFYKNIAKESPEQAEIRQQHDALAAQEPERYATDMFGESAENPQWTGWKSELDSLGDKLAASGLDWNRYAKMMRGNHKALEAVQDAVRSSVSQKFVEAHNRLKPDSPLKLGRTVVRNNLNHLSAVDPGEREKRLSMERSLVDSMRQRSGGKYAPGSVGDKLDEQKHQAFGQAQMGFFASDDLPAQDKPLAADERHTVGHAAEAQIAKMMGVVGKNFEPGKPVKLFHPSMSGPDGVKRQRAIKHIVANKRTILAAGVGSGKTALGLGAFAHLHSAGKVKKGLFAVPSVVRGQFGAEALRFLEAGKFKWDNTSESFEDRMKSYKDPETHFSVVTHQTLRDDIYRMASQQDGLDENGVRDKLAGMSKKERAAYVKSVLDKEGISFDYVMADEAHGLLNREGKENSGMSNAIEGLTDNSEYFVNATGDPVKNDASEAFSLLQKMDGDRYHDRDAFMRRYGGDTAAARNGLQRELARHQYAMAITPDVKVTKSDVTVPQTEVQQAALEKVEKDVAALRIARMSGTVDVAAAKRLSPMMFDGVPEEKHEEVARTVAESAGIIKQSAVRRVLDDHPAGGKLAKVAEIAAERKGKQGVVFARTLAAVENIRKRLEADGHRVITLSGADSAKDKGAKIQAFNPDAGEASADIIVCSDAGQTGANLQSGRWLLNYDTPDTAMGHAQRNGRIARVGQKNDVELIHLHADHDTERRAMRRLSRKYDLREMMTSPLDGLDDTGLAAMLRARGFGEPKSQASLF